EGGVGVVGDRYGCVPVSWGQEEAQFRWDVHGQVGPVHVARMPCLRGWWSGFGAVGGGVGVGVPGGQVVQEQVPVGGFMGGVVGQVGTQQWCAQAGEEESAVVAFGRVCERKDAVEQDPCAVDLAEASVQFGF